MVVSVSEMLTVITQTVSYVCYVFTRRGNGNVSTDGMGHETGRMGGDQGENKKRTWREHGEYQYDKSGTLDRAKMLWCRT